MPLRRYFRPSLRLHTLSLPWCWAGSTLLVLLAFGLRYLLYGASPTLPFLFFLPAVIASSIIFDRGSGFFATALSAVLAMYFFIEPVRSLAPRSADDTLNVVLFCLAGGFTAAMIEILHAAYLAADMERARAETEKRERELLLSEFRHRVSNDLHRLVGMMVLQARHAGPEGAAVLREMANRVQVMARVHDRLARRDGHALVDVREFLHDLVADLRTSVTELRPIGMFVEAETHMMSVSRTGAVGLIVSELVTNALKHAFPPEQEGAITVALRQEQNGFVLTVSDNGIGIPQGLREQQATTDEQGGMGSRLVHALTAQLGGHMETLSQAGGGTTHIVRFPVTPPGDPDHPPFAR